MALTPVPEAAAPVAGPAASPKGSAWHTVGDALVDGPLPAQEPEAALTMLDCRLESADSCALIAEAPLALPWAWHRAGYTVHVDYEPIRTCASNELNHHRGCARRAPKEIWVYPDWSYMVESLADIGGDLDMERAMATTLRTFAHEVGHAMHQTCSDEQAKLAAYRDARGLPTDAPLRGHGHVDGSRSSVAEDFAETAQSHLLALAGMDSPSRSYFPPPSDPDAVAGEFSQVCSYDEDAGPGDDGTPRHPSR